MIKKITLSVFTVLLVLGATLNSRASHVPGGNITYECIGPNQFKLILTLFEDCGTAFQGTGNLNIVGNNTCGFPVQNVSVTNTIYQQEVSQLCPAQIGQSECNNGTLPGIYMHRWEGIVTLPGQCNTWTFSFSLCCRNTSTNMVGQGTFFIETELNSVTAPCNNSVVINAQPIPYVCANQNVYYSFGAADPDGDSLSFAFIQPQSANNIFINYQSGYSLAAPILPSITLNSATGLLTFNTPTTGNYVIAVIITEYDDDGNPTGSVIQDFQFEVINCTNQTPLAPVQITNYTGDGTLTLPDKVNLCLGESCCFDLVFTDPDTADILSVDPFFSSLPAGCSYTITGTNPITVNVCLVAQPSQGASYDIVSLNVKDNACPINGLANFNVLLSSFSIEMSVATTTPTCPGIDDGSMVATADTAGTYDFYWYALPDTSNTIQFNDDANTTTSMNNMAPGSYLVVISDSSGQCKGQEYVTLASVNEPFATISITPSACPGVSNGSITATAQNGVGPWDYEWSSALDTSITLQNDQNIAVPSTFGSIPSGTFYLVMTSSAGCSSDTLITVGTGAFTINLGITNASCSMAPNGALTAMMTSGTSPWDYQWANSTSPGTILQNDQNITGTSNFGSLLPGTYIVTYTDAAGCTDDTTLTVGFGNVPITNTNIVTHETCAVFDNGAITVTATNGTSPWDYVWVNTASPSTVIQNDQNLPGASSMTGLASGTYQISMTDAFGCTGSIQLVVNQGVVVTPSFSVIGETCYNYADGSINLTGMGGVGPYTYIILGPENDTLSTTNFSDLTAGNYYGYVYDVNGCYDSIPITVPAATPVIAAFTFSPGLGNPPLVVTFDNQSTGATGYIWDFGDTTGSILTDPTHTYYYENHYPVVLIATNGVCADTAYGTVIVAISHITFPNVFSPNGDGINDLFHFQVKNVAQLTAVIFNRWGLKVWETGEPTAGWDGKDLGGQFVSDGTYFVIVDALGLDGKEYHHHGTVNVFGRK